MHSAWEKRGDIAMTAMVWGAAALVAFALFCLLGDLVWHGARHLSWDFLFSSPESAGRAGGIAPILVSTALILVVALAAVIPLGLATAIVLSEFAPRTSALARGINVSLDILAGVPSIVFGLFGNAFFCVYLGLGFSILSGGLTLACMILPIFIRAASAGLSAVPEDWRKGALALGLTRQAALRHLLLPAAAPALGVGLILGCGRAMAETAALVFTSGYVDRMPSALSDSGRALAVHIYDLSMNVTGGDKNAYASSLVLIMLLLAINGTSSWVMEKFLHRRIVYK
ncbi:MAG: phosphate ABC transporter permease PstA [Pseudomonadota bacterium]